MRLTTEQARSERDTGIQRAMDAASRRDSSWPERAYDFLITYAKYHRTFTAEELTLKARDMGCEPETDMRAWGSVFTKAAKGKCPVIAKIGYGQSKGRHLSICVLWSSNIFRGMK